MELEGLSDENAKGRLGEDESWLAVQVVVVQEMSTWTSKLRLVQGKVLLQAWSGWIFESLSSDYNGTWVQRAQVV
jgi:hypothetical protein